MGSVSFFVPGQPVGKGRARFSRKTGRAYTPEKTVSYEGIVALCGYEAMDGRDLLEGAVAVKITAVFQIPASWSAKKKAAAMHHTGKPDADNIGKAAGDALNGIVWRDDSQIACMVICKQYGDTPGLHVFAEALA